MNIIDLQEALKGMSEQQLVSEMQAPTGNAPQFLVLSELTRRNKMRQDYAKRQSDQAGTVADDAIAASGMSNGGIAAMAQSMAPRTEVAQNTGVDPVGRPVGMAPPQPMAEVQGMAEGGRINMRGIVDGVRRDAGPRTRNTQGGHVEPRPQDITGGRLWDFKYAKTHREDGSPIGPRGIDALIPYGGVFDRPFVQDNRDMNNINIPGISAPVSQAGMPKHGAWRDGLVTPDFDATGDMPYVSAPDLNATQRAEPSGFPPNISGMDINEARTIFGGDIRGSGNDPYGYTPPPSMTEADIPLEAFGGSGDGPAPQALYSPWIDRPTAFTGRKPPQNSSLRESLDKAKRYRQELLEPLGEFVHGPRFRPPSNFQSPSSDDNRHAEEMSAMDINEARAAASKPVVIPEEGEKPVKESPTLDQLIAAESAPKGGGGSGGSGGGGGGGGASSGRFSSYEQFIQAKLDDLDKQEKRDKWLALAKAGAVLMSSDNPTFGGAIGEAFGAGISSLQESLSEADKREMELMAMKFQVQGMSAAEARARAGSAVAAKKGIKIPAGIASTAYKDANSLTREIRELQGQIETGYKLTEYGPEPITEAEIPLINRQIETLLGLLASAKQVSSTAIGMTDLDVTVPEEE